MMGRLTTGIVLALTTTFLYPRLDAYTRFLARELFPPALLPVEGQTCEHVHADPGVMVHPGGQGGDGQGMSADEAFFGCEDFSMWIREGRMDVVAACDPHKEKWNTVMGPLEDPSSSGHLFLIPAGPSFTSSPSSSSSNRPTPTHIPIIDAPPNWNFHPHGTSVLHRSDIARGDLDGGGQDGGNEGDWLAVINWAETGSVVEWFTLEEGREGVQARWMRTDRSEGGKAFRAPNAIVAVSPMSFYLTHDHLFNKRPAMLPFPLSHTLLSPLVQPMANTLKHALGTIETFGFLPGGSVELVTVRDGVTSVRQATERIPFANGMGINPVAPGAPRGRYLAVASSVLQTLVVYDTAHPTSSGRASKVHTIRVPMLPDNVVWRETANASVSEIIVAGHPGYLRFLRMLKDTSRPAPSLVVSIPVAIRPDGGIEVGEHRVVYRDEGDEYPTSTTGDRDALGRLWVSGILAKGLLVCKEGERDHGRVRT